MNDVCPEELTATQHGYLHAFDRLLGATTEAETAGAQRAMGVLYELMLEDAATGIVPADSDHRSAAKYGCHVRWHANRGQFNPGCAWCEQSAVAA